MKKLCIIALVLFLFLTVLVGCNQSLGQKENAETTAEAEASTPTAEPTVEYVDPAKFGAVGNGKTDDTDALECAIDYASKNGKILKLPRKDYYTSRPIALNNVEILSENAKISFYGMQASVPAIDMHDNVTIKGRLRIWTVDNTKETGNHGGRCAMGFGNYGTGVGAHNCYVEDLVVMGGYYNCNGILITGDSSDITLKTVTVAGSSIIGRPILIHWGNADDHYPEYIDGKRTGNYLHAENADPTTHPHDIYVGKLICADLSNDAGDCGAFFISGAYNITIDEIVANNVRTALTVTGGDGGFSHASPAEREHGSKNIVVKKITATDVTCNGIYYTIVSSYNNIPPFYGELKLGDVSISFKEGNRANGPTFNGIQSLEIEKLTLIGAKSHGVYLMNGCKNVNIFEINLENCAASSAAVIYATNTETLQLARLNASDSAFSSVLSIDSSCKKIHFMDLEMEDSTLASIYYARNTIGSTNEISVGQSAYGDIPFTKGSSCSVEVNKG
ncbi:MAG: hypothetical protein IKD07_05875 [Clostridia bacterium]|nr:hypothetical protein [Clostridia bacterium]